ncbi:unnamed protein product [Anisakis simplex]|uniref:Fibronectin type-III domain-containing protein n=1 Tax=Anisakis simplex TaxID=6269 RepID=A0A0M3JKQ9_ANISI|nr:unnamed protein product [Anisakis simplex]
MCHQASVEVRILGPGSAPTDIVATLDSLGLHVSWNPPSITNGQIKNYIVYWTADEHKELAHWKQVLVTGNQLRTSIAVDNQTDAFFIRVQSSSVNGAGIVSDTVTSKPSITGSYV